MRQETFVRALLVLGVLRFGGVAPYQNDSWWHLRTGREILARGEVPLEDFLSFTAAGRPWPNHEWLAQVLFTGAHALLGPAGPSLVCGLAAAGAVAAVAPLLPTRWRISLPLACVAFPLLAMGVTVRPQVFTLLGVGLTARLLATRRTPWELVPWFALWANLHGGVALGGLAMGAACLAAAVTDRARLASLLPITAACGLATACSPLGTGLWTLPLESMPRLQALGIQEWAHAGTDLPGLVFWATAVGVVAAAARLATRPGRWSERVLLAVALAFVPATWNAIRNLPLLLLVGAPAIASAFAGPAPDPAPEPEPEPAERAAVHRAIAGVSTLAVAALLLWDWTHPTPRSGWTPLAPAAVAAVRAAPEPMYVGYDHGGYLLWFTPERKVFADSRQDPYPLELLEQAIAADRTGEVDALLARGDLRSAFVPAGSRIAAGFQGAGWVVSFRDDRWTVLAAPQRP